MTEGKISSTGGARVGWANATWPFATLTVTRDQLKLNATLLGKYTFSADQIVSIEEYGTNSLLSSGVQIKHNVASYPSQIVFWCLGSPASLIAKIVGTGFAPCASPDSVPANRGIPTRWQALVAIVVLWNFLFIAGVFVPLGEHPRPVVFFLVAVLLVFLGSVAIWRVRWLQWLVLKPGRSLGEIKAFLYLLASVSGTLSLAFGCAVLAGKM